MHAVRIDRNGGPEVLSVVDVPEPVAESGHVLVDVTYAGVNFIDVYHREGAYPLPLPVTLGLEGSGRVRTTGQRVAWAAGLGSYAQSVAVKSDALVEIPDGVDDDTACAAMLQGLTAHYLVTSSFAVQSGQTVLVHAAAGGVGLLLCQMISARGATVIGTVSTPEKAEAALAAGATHVIGYDSISAKVRELTDGVGVHAVYDGVGRDTFDESLASLRRRGMLVLFGAASGQPDPLDLRRLAGGGSLSVTRPSLGDFTTTPEELRWRAGEIFEAHAAGKLTFAIGGVYPLAQVAQAHRDLEARRTSGKLLLSLS